MFELLVGLRRAITADPDATDARGEVEMAVLMIGDVARRIQRRLELDELDDPRAAADLVFRTLRGVGVGDLGRLLGVSTRTVNAWRKGGPVTRNARRVVLLAQLLLTLQESMTAAGLTMWFGAARFQLGGRSPLDLLDEDAAIAREALVPLTRGFAGR